MKPPEFLFYFIEVKGARRWETFNFCASLKDAKRKLAKAQLDNGNPGDEFRIVESTTKTTYRIMS